MEEESQREIDDDNRREDKREGGEGIDQPEYITFNNLPFTFALHQHYKQKSVRDATIIHRWTIQNYNHNPY